MTVNDDSMTFKAIRTNKSNTGLSHGGRFDSCVKAGVISYCLTQTIIYYY